MASSTQPPFQPVETLRPQCGSGTRSDGYNTSLHVAALVIILVLSTVACSFPIVVRRFPRLPVPHSFLFYGRHFGTGTLIATAFVHLLPTAFVSLTDPCLPPFWNKTYPAMAGFIAMLAVMVVVSIEMFFAMRGAGHVHGAEYGTLGVVIEGRNSHKLHDGADADHAGNGSMPARTTEDALLLHNPQGRHSKEFQRLNGKRQSLTHQPSSHNEYEDSTVNDEDYYEDEDATQSPDNLGLDPALSSSQTRGNDKLLWSRRKPYEGQLTGRYHRQTSSLHALSTNGLDSAAVTAEQQEEQRMVLQCFLLEAGILFHSIFIGMALSVATGTSFLVLLVAISFHQTFEGLALGSRIAAISAFSARSPKPWLMALAYGTTTPVGQAIGLIVHNLYDPFSETGLLMVGIMNAISSGLLLFAGLVELLAEDFLSEKSYDTLRGKRRLQACVGVLCGALLMAFVGAFA